MIKINLLPQEAIGKAVAGPSSSGGGSVVMVAAVLAVMYLGIIGGAWFVYQQGETAKKAEAALKKQNDDLKTTLSDKEKEFKEVSDALAVLRNQKAVLDTLDPPDRLFWAEKWNILPALVPDGVYITDIKVTEDVKEIETEESRAAQAEFTKAKKPGTPPKKQTTPVITQKLEIMGVAYVAEGTSDQRLQLVIDFYRSLQDKKAKIPFSGEEVDFLRYMNPTISYDPVEGISVNGREVTKFKFYVQSKPSQAAKKADAAKPAPAAAAPAKKSA